MRAYSLDLRERVVKAVLAGMSSEEAAIRYEISWATAKRYVKQYLERGDLHPKTQPGRPSTLSEVELAVLSDQRKKHSDANLEEHCALFKASTGIQVSTSTMQRLMKQLSITRKKEP